MTTTGSAVEFDVIVLGLGPGGEEVAERLAEAGLRVLGIEPHLVGGECPYYGCIPSKMMVRAAETLAEASRVDALAGHAEVSTDFTKVAARIRTEATDDWNDQAAADRFTGLGGVLARGAGSFVGRSGDGRPVVEVSGQRYVARLGVVVATGTAPALPPIPGLAELAGSLPAGSQTSGSQTGGSQNGGSLPAGSQAGGSQTGAPANPGELSPQGLVWTNREIMQITQVPESLLVIGGGAIGCELAQAVARFGTHVTQLEAGPRLLGPEEPEASDVITAALRQDGVQVHTGVEIARIERADGGESGGGVTAVLKDGQSFTGQRLLVAAGRRGHLPELGLDSIGLQPDGATLTVDDHMQVAPGIFAVGDATGRGAFTHVAVWQARVLVAHLLQRREPFGGYAGLAWVTFTDPEVGRVGMTEQQARERGIDVVVGSTDVAASTRGWIHGPGNDGFVKLIADRARGVLVGATVVAPGGGEILGMLTLAVHAEVPVRTMASMHYAYPTLHRAVSDAVTALQL